MVRKGPVPNFGKVQKRKERNGKVNKVFSKPFRIWELDLFKQDYLDLPINKLLLLIFYKKLTFYKYTIIMYLNYSILLEL